jgi:hypothetical protein
MQLVYKVLAAGDVVTVEKHLESVTIEASGCCRRKTTVDPAAAEGLRASHLRGCAIDREVGDDDDGAEERGWVNLRRWQAACLIAPAVHGQCASVHCRNNCDAVFGT